MLTIQEWIKKVSQVSVAVKIICAASTVMFLILCSFSIAEQYKWDERLRSWKRVDGVILKNETKWVRSGKSRKKVSEISYRFEYQGKIRYGKRKLFDSDRYPAPAGAKRKILVNPANPDESAAMLFYRSKWYGYLDRFFPSLLSFAMGIICFFAFKNQLFPKKITVPLKLEFYLRNFKENKFSEIDSFEIRNFKNNIIVPFKKVDDLLQPRIIFSNGTSYLGIAVIAIHILLFSIAAIVSNRGYWIFVAFWMLVLFLCLKKNTLVADFVDRRFYFCNKFNENKKSKYSTLAFDEIECIGAGYMFNGKKRMIILSALTAKRQLIPLVAVDPGRLQDFLDFLPDFCSRIGNPPVIFFETSVNRKKSRSSRKK